LLHLLYVCSSSDTGTPLLFQLLLLLVVVLHLSQQLLWLLQQQRIIAAYPQHISSCTIQLQCCECVQQPGGRRPPVTAIAVPCCTLLTIFKRRLRAQLLLLLLLVLLVLLAIAVTACTALATTATACAAAAVVHVLIATGRVLELPEVTSPYMCNHQPAGLTTTAAAAAAAAAAA
jgi:hypothetical protein